MKKILLLLVCATMMVASNASNLPKKVNHTSKATLQVVDNSVPHLPISPVASKTQSNSQKAQAHKVKVQKSLMAKQQVMASAVSGPKKNVAEGVFYTRPEGSFAYGWDKDGMGYYNSWTMVAPYKEFELVNQCTNKNASSWNWVGDADAAADFITDAKNFMWSQQGATGYYMPTITSGTTQYTWAQTDNTYGDSYKSAMRCADRVSPFTLTDPHMGPDYIGWGFLSSHFLFGDGQLDNGGKLYQCFAVKQSFPKPMSPLYVEDIYISLLNLDSKTFLKAGEELTLDIVNADGDVLYTLTAGAEDLILDEDDPYESQYGDMRFATAVFSMKDVDPLTGDVAAVPFVLDEAFTVVISGFEGKNIGFRGHFMMDDNDIDTAEASVVENGYLDFYNVDDESEMVSYTFQNKIAIPMTFTAMFDAAQVWTSAYLADGTELSDFNVLKVSADGKTIENAGYAGTSLAIVNTASSWIDENETEVYYLADAQDEFPEWLAYGVDNSMWEDLESEDFEPIVYVGFEAEALPEGVTGRGVKLYVNGRGIVSEDPIYVLQGDYTKEQVDAEEGGSNINGLFVASANTETGNVDYDFDSAIEFVWDDENEAMAATVGTQGKSDTWVNEVMISTVRGNDRQFKANTFKVKGAVIEGIDNWIDFEEGANAKIKLPAQGVWTIYVDTDASVMAFVELEGDTPRAPITIVPNETEMVVNAVERDYTNDEVEGSQGQPWDNQFMIMANRTLAAGEVTIIEFDYMATADANTNTQCGGSEAGAYIHWNALGDVMFTPEWQHFTKTFTVPSEANNMQSITFNMAVVKEANEYHLKNFVWKLEDETETLINMEGDDNFWMKVGANTAPFTSDSYISAESITLNKKQIEIAIGSIITLSAIILPENATNKNVTWTTNNSAIATVENGVVKGISAGTATITATTTDGSNLSASCVVTVKNDKATSITLNTVAETIAVGITYQLVATVLPEDIPNKSVSWYSSNSAVANVDQNGLVRANKVGEAMITAKTNDGSNLSATCKITVASVLATEISLNMTEANLYSGDGITLQATILPEDATNKTVIWRSSDENVATVDDGFVIALHVGTTTITATTTDGSNISASCTVNVQKQIQIINWNPSTITVDIAGELFKLDAETTSELPIAYTSSDETIANIFDLGAMGVFLNPICTGEVTVTASQAGDENYYPAESVSKVFTIIDTSGINDLYLDEHITIYTLNGFKVGTFTKEEIQKLKLAKGVYIVNGKKMIVE